MGKIESYNWSGARIRKEVLPAGQVFTSIKATWKVPTVGPHPPEKDVRSAAWIALDGGTWGYLPDKTPVPVLQAGTYHQLSGGKTNYFAFFGLFDDGDPDLPDTGDLYTSPSFFRFNVRLHDTMVVVLTYTPGTPAGQAMADFTGSTSAPPGSGAKFTIQVPDKTILDKTIKGDTAEWVFERISKDNDSSPSKDYHNKYYPLGIHDHFDFDDAMAQTGNLKWISPDRGDSIVMLDIDNLPDVITVGNALSNKVEIKERR